MFARDSSTPVARRSTGVLFGWGGTSVLALALLGWLAAAGRPDEPPGAPAALHAFAPGVWIAWQTPAVHVATHVVLREGPLEFLACLAGKEHESILRIESSAAHLYQALGLIGLEPGQPPAWNPRTDAFDDPTGSLVSITLVTETAAGRQAADASAWLRELEYHREPLARPWVFSGSRRLPDGSLSSDRTGVGVALVDFEDSLLSYSRRFPSSYAALWVEANTVAIPSEDTQVWMVLQAARLRPRTMRLDARGVARVDGRYCSWADLADLIQLQWRLDAAYVQTITLEGVLGADRVRLERALRAAGVSSAAYGLEEVWSTGK